MIKLVKSTHFSSGLFRIVPYRSFLAEVQIMNLTELYLAESGRSLGWPRDVMEAILMEFNYDSIDECGLNRRIKSLEGLQSPLVFD